MLSIWSNSCQGVTVSNTVRVSNELPKSFSLTQPVISLVSPSRIRVCTTPSATAVSTAARTSGVSSWTRVTRPRPLNSGCLRKPTPPCWSTSIRAPSEVLQHPRGRTRAEVELLLLLLRTGVFPIYLAMRWQLFLFGVLGVRQDGTQRGLVKRISVREDWVWVWLMGFV